MEVSEPCFLDHVAYRVLRLSFRPPGRRCADFLTLTAFNVWKIQISFHWLYPMQAIRGGLSVAVLGLATAMRIFPPETSAA